MNKKLALQTKEDFLEILDWSNGQNRKVSLECINEIAERALQDINAWLKEDEKVEPRVPARYVNADGEE